MTILYGIIVSKGIVLQLGNLYDFNIAVDAIVLKDTPYDPCRWIDGIVQACPY